MVGLAKQLSLYHFHAIFGADVGAEATTVAIFTGNLQFIIDHFAAIKMTDCNTIAAKIAIGLIG